MPFDTFCAVERKLDDQRHFFYDHEFTTMADCGFFKIVSTPQERYQVLRDWEAVRKRTARIRDASDRIDAQAYRKKTKRFARASQPPPIKQPLFVDQPPAALLNEEVGVRGALEAVESHP